MVRKITSHLLRFTTPSQYLNTVIHSIRYHYRPLQKIASPTRKNKRLPRSLNMVSAKSLVLLIGVIAPGTVMAAPTEATVAAPPVVQIAPATGPIPNTEPFLTPQGPGGNASSTISGTMIKFWKTRLFRGQSIATILDKPAGTCCKFTRGRAKTKDLRRFYNIIYKITNFPPKITDSFQGDVWGEFNKNTDSVEVLGGGPCTLYSFVSPSSNSSLHCLLSQTSVELK